MRTSSYTSSLASTSRLSRTVTRAAGATPLNLSNCGARPRLRKPPTFGVALAPALRRRPALEMLTLTGNPFGDKGLAALVAPPQPAAGALPPLAKLMLLDLDDTQVSDAGCAALSSALNSGTLPDLVHLDLKGIPASPAAKSAVHEALDSARLLLVARQHEAVRQHQAYYDAQILRLVDNVAV